VFAGLIGVAIGAVVFGAGGARARRASSVAGKRDKAKREREHAIDEAKKRGDLGAMERILFDVLGERAGADARGRPTDELQTLLQDRLDATLVNDIVKLIRDLESARFMPGAGSERARLVDAAIAIVRRLDA